MVTSQYSIQYSIKYSTNNSTLYPHAPCAVDSWAYVGNYSRFVKFNIPEGLPPKLTTRLRDHRTSLCIRSRTHHALPSGNCLISPYCRRPVPYWASLWRDIAQGKPVGFIAVGLSTPVLSICHSAMYNST